MPLYDEDLARIHHEGYGDFSRGVASGLLEWFRARGVGRGTVVDLGCGSGIWLRELGRAGYDGVGIDVSTALIQIASNIAPRARLQVASVHDIDLPLCDAITALGEVLSYIPPGAKTGPSLRPLISRAHRALREGGLFAFDLYVHSGAEPARVRTWQAAEDWACLVEALENRPRTRLTREITRFLKDEGSAYRRSRVRHVLTISRRERVERLLREQGSSVRVSRRYGDYALPPRRLAFLAQKRK